MPHHHIPPYVRPAGSHYTRGARSVSVYVSVWAMHTNDEAREEQAPSQKSQQRSLSFSATNFFRWWLCRLSNIGPCRCAPVCVCAGSKCLCRFVVVANIESQSQRYMPRLHMYSPVCRCIVARISRIVCVREHDRDRTYRALRIHGPRIQKRHRIVYFSLCRFWGVFLFLRAHRKCHKEKIHLNRQRIGERTHSAPNRREADERERKSRESWLFMLYVRVYGYIERNIKQTALYTDRTKKR